MNDWTTSTLGDLGEPIIGLTYSPSQISMDGTLVLRSSNIQNGQLALDDVVRVSAPIPEKIITRKGDILICVRNGSRPLIGKSLYLDERVEGETFGAFMSVFRSPLNPYLRFFFQSDSFKRQVDEHLGATINQITNASLRSFVASYPRDDRERHMIAAALSDAEDHITSLDRVIAKKRDIKRGMMQELLTGRIRLPGFTAGWAPVTLGKVGATYGGLAGKSGRDFGHGSGRFVTFVELMRDARLLGRDLSPVDIKRGERQNVVRRGDVLFNGSSETPEEVALAAAVEFDAKGVYLNSFCFGYRLNRSDEVDPLFLAYLFRAAPGRQLVVSLAQGSTRYNIAKTKLMSSSIELPELAEQQAIVNVLRDADDEIHTLEDRLQSARAVKQGMMQELLTGRTRLHAEEVMA